MNQPPPPLASPMLAPRPQVWQAPLSILPRLPTTGSTALNALVHHHTGLGSNLPKRSQNWTRGEGSWGQLQTLCVGFPWKWAALDHEMAICGTKYERPCKHCFFSIRLKCFVCSIFMSLNCRPHLVQLCETQIVQNIGYIIISDCYFVILGQYRAVLFGTWQYWASMGGTFKWYDLHG